jgi:DNA polymerase-4
VFGDHGHAMWKKANGLDDSPVIPYTEEKSISTEQTFQQDTIDVHHLESMLVAMTEKLAQKLRNQSKLASVVTVKLRYANFETFTRQERVAYTAADHLLIPRVKELFRKLYERRMLVRLIGVRFSGLVHGQYQIDLFDDSEERVNLYQALDHLNRRYGTGTVHRAAGMDYTRRASFNPFKGSGA